MKENSKRFDCPEPFLEALAKAYASRYEDMSDFCFLFPNRRSGTFFLRHLSRALGERTIIAPQTAGIADFVATIARRDVASRIDLVFRLYRVYRSLSGRVPALSTEEDILDFDRFAPWGEILLGDFSEVDQYDVDASEIFRNVRDYREISSNFLTEEQRHVIERYFGYSPSPAEVERFWRSVGDEEDRGRLKQKFVELWEILPELYEGLREDLEKDLLAMEGSTYRLALERVIAEGRAALPWKKVVVAGFNSLSTTESLLFSEMSGLESDIEGEDYVDFFWDATGPVLNSDDNPVAAAMKRLRKNFPEPEWASPFMAKSLTGGMPPSITEEASPSNAAQTKIAAMKVEEWLADPSLGREGIKDARAAIVIPDENLLMPLLYSLPVRQEGEEGGLDSINLTMGYSMRYTSVASFMFHLRKLMLNRRVIDGEPAFVRTLLRTFLSHPLVHVVAGSDKVCSLNACVQKYGLRMVPLHVIREISAPLADMLDLSTVNPDAAGAISYLRSVLAIVEGALAAGENGVAAINTPLERSQLVLYVMALGRIEQCIERYGVDMRFNSVFHLVDRLLAGEKVTFEGEPLEGLQLMGLLETRALDFDNLVILSMNDKIMPRRARKRTFIPDSLRRGYGLPLSNYGESLYTYYFYRLISRAREVTLIYDARAGEGMRSGGKSRLLLQLDMLYARGNVRHIDYSFELNPSRGKASEVKKEEETMRKLREYLQPGSGRNLSVSALQNYCHCPVKFYYNNIVGVKDDEDKPDYIDSMLQGTIVHEALQKLYVPDKKLRNIYLKERIVLTEKALKDILDDPEKISRAVREAVNEKHFHLEPSDWNRPLSGAAALVAERLERQVRDVVAHDHANAPLVLAGVEMKGLIRWSCGSSPVVNMKYALDRVDIVGDRFRIVDYKTGKANVSANLKEDLFNGTRGAKNILQLMLYADFLDRKVKEEDGRGAGDIGIVIYETESIAENGPVMPEVEKTRLTGNSQLRGEFLAGMEGVLSEIFDPDVPFIPADNDESCQYCKIKDLCGRG